MQTPVFLTEPPQIQDSPTPRRRKKRSKRRHVQHLAADSRTGWESGRESGRDSPRSMDFNVVPKKTTRASMDKMNKGQELDLTIVPEILPKAERPAKLGHDTTRSVRIMSLCVTKPTTWGSDQV